MLRADLYSSDICTATLKRMSATSPENYSQLTFQYNLPCLIASRSSYNRLQHKANAVLLRHRKTVKVFAPLHQLVFGKENNMITKSKLTYSKTTMFLSSTTPPHLLSIADTWLTPTALGFEAYRTPDMCASRKYASTTDQRTAAL